MNLKTSPRASKGHTCPWWLLFTFDNPIRKLIHNPEKMLAAYITPGDTVMDVGCGMGFFTLGLARLAGASGKVIAVDLQVEMLRGLHKRAEQTGLMDRIQLHQSTPSQIGVTQPVDSVLAFWMVHEVRQPAVFLQQVFDTLKPGGKFLLVEPIIHVSRTAFERTVSLAEQAGFQVDSRPNVNLSRAIVLSKSRQ